MMMMMIYTVCRNYRNPNFQGQNLVNMRFICTKISWPRHEIMLREVLPELSTICTAFTVQRLSQRDVTVTSLFTCCKHGFY